VTVGPQQEAPQASPRDEGAGDAVTVAFGDPRAGVYGLARVGLVPGGQPTASGMGILFAGSEPVAVRAEGSVPVERADWEVASAAGVRTAVLEPLRRWRMTFDGAFDVVVEALAPPAVVDAESRAARTGGMEGYEQLCRVRGTATVGGGERRIDCLGQRGHSWGRPDWSKLALARTVSAWFDDATAVTLTAVRDQKAEHHADEAVAAYLVEDGMPVEVSDPRLSTTYDAGERQVHAGLELWVPVPGDGDGEIPHRAAGEVVCGTTIDLGRLRLDCAFFAWRMEGRAGIGRYDVLRRAA
jgi:hypothetical protein